MAAGVAKAIYSKDVGKHDVIRFLMPQSSQQKKGRPGSFSAWWSCRKCKVVCAKRDAFQGVECGTFSRKRWVARRRTLERIRLEKPEDFVTKAYTKEEVRATYTHAIGILCDIPEEPKLRRGKKNAQ